MGKNRLKIGSASLNLKQKKKSAPLTPYIEKPLLEVVKTKNYKLLDKHGGVVRYSMGQKDIFAKGRVVALGDAVSAINPLGGEGIRHAMKTARVAAECIHTCLKQGEVFVQDYEPKMREYFGVKWRECEKRWVFIYKWAPDFLVHLIVSSYVGRYPTLDQLCKKLFDYEFSNRGYWLMLQLFKNLTSIKSALRPSFNQS